MTNDEKRLDKAAEHLGAGALKLIKAILLKHDAAIIEASQEAVEAAVAAEREACAKVCETLGVHPLLNVYAGGPDWYKHGKDIAAAIRLRGEQA